MAKDSKKIKMISTLFFVLVLTGTILFSQPKKALAWGVVMDWLTETNTGIAAGSSATSTGIKIKEFATEILKQAISTIEVRVLQQMTMSTVNWINSGFSGSPLFVQNPDSFFNDIGKFEIKNLVNEFGYNTINYPFGQSWSLNIINTYKTQLSNNAQYSLSQTVNDPSLLNSYMTNPYAGGWNAFLINTQYPQNNYIGYTEMMNNEIALRVAGTVQNNVQKVQTALNQGSGFLSPKICPSNPSYNNGINEFHQPSFDSSSVPYNVPECIPMADTSGCSNQADIDAAMASGGKTPIPKCVYAFSANQSDACQNQDAINQALADYNQAYDSAQSAWAKTNSCPGGLQTTTPGSVVANHIQNALSSQFRQSELGQALGNSISSIIDSLMNHFLSAGLSGLANATNNSSSGNNDTWNYDGQTLSGTASSNSLSIPTNVSVGIGKTTSNTISGGTAPYSIQTAGDNTIATVAISDTTISVTGVAAGQTSFTIQDSSATPVTATVTVTVSSTGTLTLDFSNPTAISQISAGTTAAVNMGITGGTLPYNIQTGPDSSVAMAMISGSTLTIIGTSPGVTSVTISDSSATPNTITLSVNIGNHNALSISPQNVSVIVGNSANVTISGGTTPFIVTSPPDPNIAGAVISGNTLIVTGSAVGTTSVTIQDSFQPASTITIPISVVTTPPVKTGTVSGTTTASTTATQ